MRKVMNQTHLEGYLYENNLEMKVTGPKSKNPGTQYITGTISIATDGTTPDTMTNVIPVHFTYVTATTGKGSANATFSTLKDIIDGKMKTVTGSGVEAAAKLRIDSVIGLNEFYSDHNGQEELVSVMRNEGGFIHTTATLNPNEAERNTFNTDIIITKVTEKEADEERGLAARAIIKGYTFNFRNELLPVELVAYHPGAINYFTGINPTEKTPLFTNVWGRQMSTTVIRKIVKESAFGEDDVREVPSSRKEFVIEHARKEAYDWDDENSITVAEFDKLKSDRETTLAALKSRSDEYKASRNNVSTTTPVAPSNSSEKFDF